MSEGFNKYLWKLYLESGGAKMVSFFEEQLSSGMTAEYAKRIAELQSCYAADKGMIEWTNVGLNDAMDAIVNMDSDIIAEDSYQSFVDSLNRLWEFYLDERDSEKEAFKGFIENIVYDSTLMGIYDSTLAIPYYFTCNFNVFMSIAEAFDIELPPIPAKSDYKRRFYYYGQLCEVLNDYKDDNNWSRAELLAFLYDFAPKYIGGIDSYIIKDLPEPKSAFFVGGGGKNGDEIAENDADAIYRWQSSPDTRAGDMIVMYLTSPISAISSVWRACSVGFNDPFFYYYRCTYIGNPVKGKRIGIDVIKKDKVLSQMPLVKSNMQGVNGVELRPSDYNHILDITKINAVRLEYVAGVNNGDFECEKDVEDNIIKKVIKKLGYSENDYETQTRIPVGNHNTLLIPDFILLPSHKGRYVSAFAIIEAKRSITKKDELDAALGQARSYSLQLRTRYAAVASQEGVWITSAEDDYTEVIYQQTWDKLNDADEFMKLRGYLEKR